MKRIVILAIAMLLVSHPASADPFEPTMDEVCTLARPGVPSRVDHTLVVKRLMKYVNVHDVDLRRDQAVSHQQKVDAIFEPATFCSNAVCEKGTVDRLRTANTALIQYVRRHRNPIRTGESGFQFAFEPFDARPFLERGTLAPECRRARTDEATPPAPKTEDKSRAEGRFIVRKNVTDLQVAPGSEEFKSVQRASFSINGDRIQQTTTYAIEGIVGYGFGEVPFGTAGGSYVELIPFFSYKRQIVDGNNAKSSSNVHNIGGGIVGDLRFMTGRLSNNFEFVAHHVHSERSNADVASGKLIYTPRPDASLLPGIGTVATWGAVSVMLTPQLKLIYGEVLNAGLDPALDRQRDLTRAGSRVELAVNIESGLLEGMGLNTSYEYLRFFRGPMSNIWRFETAASYTFPNQKLWAVQIKYAGGYDLDTFERQDQYMIGVGFKY